MRGRVWLRLIAVFKFVKVLLLLAVVLGAFQMLHPDTAERAQHWVESMALHVDRRWAVYVIAWFGRLQPNNVGVIAVAAFLYAALFMTEGIGLWTEKRWAEYLTIVATISFVPFEVVELVKRQSLPRISALILNILVVIYLILRLRHSRGEPSTASS